MRLALNEKTGDRLDTAKPSAHGLFLYLIASALLLLTALGANPAQAETLDLETRVNLQLTLKQYIDAGTAAGVYEHFNVEKGQVEKLKLKTLHPVIFALNEKFMMCADFIDANGDSVMLDYIAGSSTSGYRIEQEIRGRRSYLQLFFERLD